MFTRFDVFHGSPFSRLPQPRPFKAMVRLLAIYAILGFVGFSHSLSRLQPRLGRLVRSRGCAHDVAQTAHGLRIAYATNATIPSAAAQRIVAQCDKIINNDIKEDTSKNARPKYKHILCTQNLCPPKADLRCKHVKL